MEILNKIPLWLYTGVLYGLSWPIFNGLNLSFLAWFAFVPLFLYLEKHKDNFTKSMKGSYAAMFIFGCFSAGWLFNFPQANLHIAIIFLLEELWFFIPFLLLFFIQKKIGFDKALWLLPMLWMVWEWIYLDLEFTMGTHMSAYSQSNNLWLIQYIDITGMWGVSFWLMLFNVLLFKAFKEYKEQLIATIFFKKIGLIGLVMLGIPLSYALYSYMNYDEVTGENINVTVVPTRFSAAELLNIENQFSVIETTLHSSDSTAFAMKDKGIYSDLYVWPETGLAIPLQESNIQSVLFDAVTDWQAALITGSRSTLETKLKEDAEEYVSGVLVSHKKETPSYHYKTVLTPGQEAIPYHSLLAKIPNFPVEENDSRFFKKGKVSKPLELITKDKHEFLVGISLCFEQWYPKHWVNLSKNGAEFYSHLASEGWYGEVGFMSFMANVTRMRSIENRKQTARSANVGISTFIDQLGRYYNTSTKNNNKPITKSLTALDEITFYTKYPNLFPFAGLFSLIVLFTKSLINLKKN